MVHLLHLTATKSDIDVRRSRGIRSRSSNYFRWSVTAVVSRVKSRSIAVVLPADEISSTVGIVVTVSLAN